MKIAHVVGEAGDDEGGVLPDVVHVADRPGEGRLRHDALEVLLNGGIIFDEVVVKGGRDGLLAHVQLKLAPATLSRVRRENGVKEAR